SRTIIRLFTGGPSHTISLFLYEVPFNIKMRIVSLIRSEQQLLSLLFTEKWYHIMSVYIVCVNPRVNIYRK
ncbi:hypothetical protein, partial [Okeania hirsuta]|uniref:hypothetical protein n=1 Tax=Okeania hirsuta TaxID=1458930 RepID=UPI001961A54B